MSPEVKLRTAALADTAIHALIAERWYETQLLQGTEFPAIVAQRVSTVRRDTHDGINALSWIRFQLTIWDYSAETTREIAAAVIAFLDTFDASSTAEFGSPATSPTVHPNTVLNQRTGMFPQSQPPLFHHILDVGIFNREDL